MIDAIFLSYNNTKRIQRIFEQVSIVSYPCLVLVNEERRINACTKRIGNGEEEEKSREKMSSIFRNNGETKWNVSIKMVRIPLRNLTWQDLTFSNDFLLSPFNPTFRSKFFPLVVWTHFSVKNWGGNVKFRSSGSRPLCATNWNNYGIFSLC